MHDASQLARGVAEKVPSCVPEHPWADGVAFRTETIRAAEAGTTEKDGRVCGRVGGWAGGWMGERAGERTGG